MTEVRLRSTPVIGLLTAAGAALVAAFMLAPAALLTAPGGIDDSGLPDAVGRGLAEYWQGDAAEFPALLAGLVDYWFRWHALKVVISSLMLAVFATLAVALWRRYLRDASRSAVAAIGATVFSVLATGLLILNIQATAVPLVALLPLVNGGELAPALREALTQPADSPALTVLLHEVERYHWVMVAVAAPLMLATGLAAVSLWRQRFTGDSRGRFMRRALSVILALTASLLLVVVAGSAFSALDPSGALLGAFGLS